MSLSISSLSGVGYFHSLAAHVRNLGLYLPLQRQGFEAGEMAWLLCILTALAEELGSVFRTHIQQPTDTCNSSYKEYNVFFWSPWTPVHM